MNRKRFISATVFALVGMASSGTWGGSAAGGPISAKKLAKIVPGISKAQVTALLGAPWRTVQYNDVDEIENEIWEYRGTDSGGSYRIHIEFDEHNIVLLVARIPDSPPNTPDAPAKN